MVARKFRGLRRFKDKEGRGARERYPTTDQTVAMRGESLIGIAEQPRAEPLSRGYKGLNALSR